MPDRDRRDIEKALTSKGFIHVPGRNHDLYFLTLNDKTLQIGTYISRGSDYKSYGTSLLREMSRELKINVQQLLQLIDCDLKEEQYKKLLQSKGLI